LIVVDDDVLADFAGKAFRGKPDAIVHNDRLHDLGILTDQHSETGVEMQFLDAVSGAG